MVKELQKALQECPASSARLGIVPDPRPVGEVDGAISSSALQSQEAATGAAGGSSHTMQCGSGQHPYLLSPGGDREAIKSLADLSACADDQLRQAFAQKVADSVDRVISACDYGTANQDLPDMGLGTACRFIQSMAMELDRAPLGGGDGDSSGALGYFLVPPICNAVTKLLVCAVREVRLLMDCVVNLNAELCSPWTRTLGHLSVFLRALTRHVRGAPEPQVMLIAQFLEQMVCADVLPWLSSTFTQLAAKMTAALSVRRLEGAEPSPRLLPISGIVGKFELDALVDLLSCFMEFCMTPDDRLHTLRTSLLKSRVMEHAARAVVLTYCATTQSVDIGLLQSVVVFLKTLQRVMHLSNTAESRLLTVWVDALLSGPCVQYTLLLHALSQLCAADRGTTYGLPDGALLIAVYEDLNTCDSTSDRYGRIDKGIDRIKIQNQDQADKLAIRLSTVLMSMSFRWWARNRAKPCTRQALETLCFRAVEVALMRWQAALVAEGDDKAVGAQNSREGIIAFEQAGPLALAALECARRFGRDDVVNATGSRWVLKLLQTASTAEPSGPVQGLPYFGPLQLLALQPLQSLAKGRISGVPADSVQFYIRVMERSIRVEFRRALKEPGLHAVSAVLWNFVQVLCGCGSMEQLMRIGQVPPLAALLSTSAKVLRCMADAVNAFDDDKLQMLQDLDDSLASILGFFGNSIMPYDLGARTATEPPKVQWRQSDCSFRIAAAVIDTAKMSATNNLAAPMASGGGGASGSYCSACGSSSRGTDDRANAGHLPRSLSFLSTFSAMRFVPTFHMLAEMFVKHRTARAALPRTLLHLGRIICIWVPVLILAYLDSLMTATASGMSVVTLGQTDDHIDKKIDAKESWEKWMRQMKLPELLGLMVRVVVACQEDQPSGDPCSHFGMLQSIQEQLANALLYVMFAFEEPPSDLLNMEVKPGTTLLGWFQDAGGGAVPAAAAATPADVMQWFLELAPAVANGKSTFSMKQMDRIPRTEIGEGDRKRDAEKLAAVFLPPSVVCSLPVKVCCNLRCTDLGGDSDTGCRLIPCKECEGSEVLHCESCAAQHQLRRRVRTSRQRADRVSRPSSAT
ncbi:hypothetical protein Vretimale_5641 [Volvox reticuliferus]|uniref:Uncharacterized protein n=1 Tax=Volvox reticuliferus TaxID=1737510 RepID=A0A8J4LKS6_9CHLO|nr:hypothetical protein Vretifemale_5756 [Volvox reticuliferus]GIM00728.1 hypothetical protein Vretimale_5641 [Volvox reticuliferus]